MKFIYVFCLLSLSLFGDPWGKDSNLASHQKQRPLRLSNPLVEGTIAFHQNLLSPAAGPQSHYKPSSSQYMLESIRKYGFFLGFPLGCDRLLRENEDPWIYSRIDDGTGATLKWNPVP